MNSDPDNSADRGAFRQSLSVSFDYPVHFTRNVFDAGNPMLQSVLDRRDEHLGGSLTVTLPKGLGGKVEVHQVSPDTVEEAVAFLKGARPT